MHSIPAPNDSGYLEKTYRRLVSLFTPTGFFVQANPNIRFFHT